MTKARKIYSRIGIAMATAKHILGRVPSPSRTFTATRTIQKNAMENYDKQSRIRDEYLQLTEEKRDRESE
jgi:hypothetical protein